MLGEFFAARPEDLDDELIDHGPVLRELAELARQARADSRELWYWWSL